MPSSNLLRVGIVVAGFLAAAVIAIYAERGPGSDMALTLSDLTPVEEDSSYDPETSRIRVAVAPVLSPQATLERYEELVTYLEKRLGQPTELVLGKSYGETNALARGAEEVALLMCGQKCHFRQQDSIRGTADFCRRLLDRLGHSLERVRVVSVSEPEVLSQPVHTPGKMGDTSMQPVKGELRLHATQGALEAIRRLAGEEVLAGGMVLAHPISPFGVPELRAEGCTGCRACVGACPTGSLAWEHSGNSGSLTLTASLCNGCGMCAEICPEAAERVLSVRKVMDLEALSRGTVALTRQGLAICETCVEAFASHNMLQRIGDRVGDGDGGLHVAIGRFCPSCRMTAVLNAQPVS